MTENLENALLDAETRLQAGGTGVTALLARLTGTNHGTPFEVRMRYPRTWIHDDGWRVLAAHMSVVGLA